MRGRFAVTDALKTPWHLWAVGVVSLLWNAIGANDYTQTRLRNMDYLSSMGFDEAGLAYIDGFPIWVDLAWALGVWGAVAGSFLLLLRSRFAVIAFTLSVIGAILSNLYPFMSEPPEMMQSSVATVMSLVIIGIATALLFYARRMAAAGVLR
jgi:hypothetical protein